MTAATNPAAGVLPSAETELIAAGLSILLGAKPLDAALSVVPTKRLTMLGKALRALSTSEAAKAEPSGASPEPADVHADQAVPAMGFPDAADVAPLREALVEIAELKSLTATPTQFYTHLQRIARRALTEHAAQEGTAGEAAVLRWALKRLRAQGVYTDHDQDMLTALSRMAAP